MWCLIPIPINFKIACVAPMWNAAPQGRQVKFLVFRYRASTTHQYRKRLSEQNETSPKYRNRCAIHKNHKNAGCCLKKFLIFNRKGSSDQKTAEDMKNSEKQTFTYEAFTWRWSPKITPTNSTLGREDARPKWLLFRINLYGTAPRASLSDTNVDKRQSRTVNEHDQKERNLSVFSKLMSR